MTNVAVIRPHLAAVEAPEKLRSLPGWLIWRYEQHEGEPKARKVPYYTNGGRRHGVQGAMPDRSQLTTFDAARAAAARRGYDGVGLALMPDFGVVALDFDHCMVGGGVHPEVERLVAGTYAEYSPSGQGVRAFMLGNAGNSKSHGEPFGFETFSTKGFVTFTGNRLDATDLLGAENTLVELTDDVRRLCAARFGQQSSAKAGESDDPLMAYEPVIGLTLAQIAEALDVLPLDLPYESSSGPSWLGVGMAIHHETNGSDEGFELWEGHFSQSPKYSTREYGLGKWASFGRGGQRSVTARSLVKWAHENGARIMCDVGSSAEFAQVGAAHDEAKRFPVVPAGEFSRGAHPGWILKGIIPKAELVVMFGESGSGKSFVALDMAMAIVRGVDWRGHRSKQGRVVYIAAEGGGGFRKRLAAYALHHGVGLDDLPLGIIHAAPNFLQKVDALDVARSIQAGGKADVVIVDTFAQVMPGANENAADDMGKALAHCRGIHTATGAVVLLVHHAGKDASKGARGWSGLRAAADAEIEVFKLAGARGVRVSKQKDGDDTGEWGFELATVNVGIDEDGDVIDSCVVQEGVLPVIVKANGGQKPYGVWERLILDVVSEFSLGQSEGIEIEAVVAEAVRRGPAHDGMGRDTRKQRVKRALLKLSAMDDGPFFIDGDCISVC